MRRAGTRRPTYGSSPYVGRACRDPVTGPADVARGRVRRPPYGVSTGSTGDRMRRAGTRRPTYGSCPRVGRACRDPVTYRHTAFPGGRVPKAALRGLDRLDQRSGAVRRHAAADLRVVPLRRSSLSRPGDVPAQRSPAEASVRPPYGVSTGSTSDRMRRAGTRRPTYGSSPYVGRACRDPVTGPADVARGRVPKAALRGLDRLDQRSGAVHRHAAAGLRIVPLRWSSVSRPG
jgi:hypothetical protein